jgi:hypothetical protein
MRTCQNCKAEQTYSATTCSNCYAPLSEVEQNQEPEEVLELFEADDLPLTLDPSKPQYKVITQKDRYFSAKFDPARIERALNEYAQDGWELVHAVSADMPGLGGGRNELVLFLEKKPSV